MSEPGDRLEDRLAAAPSPWQAVCALLDRWRATRPLLPARARTGPAFAAWADAVAAAEAHFHGRDDPTELTDADRSFLLEATGHGEDANGVYAAAWGMANAVNAGFAPAWRDSLGGGCRPCAPTRRPAAASSSTSASNASSSRSPRP
jgi:hypothetical protein